MIIDHIDNAAAYYDLLPGFANAVKCIEEHPTWEAGARYEFDGGFVMYQESQTKAMADGTFENHDKYIDVQILVEGGPWYSLWNRVEELTEAIPYNPEKDATRYDGTGSLLELKKGMFVVFYPADAHKPDRFLDGESSMPYKKYVAKLEVR